MDPSAEANHILAVGLSEETEDKYLAEVIHEQVKAELEKAMADSALLRKVDHMHELLRQEFQAYRSVPAVAVPPDAHDNESPALQKLQKEFAVLKMVLEEWQVRDEKQLAGLHMVLEERQMRDQKLLAGYQTLEERQVRDQKQLAGLQMAVQNVNSEEVSQLKEEVSQLRWEVAHNSEQISALKGEVANLKQHQHHQAHQKGTIAEEATAVNKLEGNSKVQEGSSAVAPSVTTPDADASENQKEHLEFSSEAVQEFVEEMDEIGFEESVWDGAFFIGMHGLNFDAFFGFWLLAVNIGFQGIFTFITWKNLAPSELDDEMIDGLRNWRLRYGHRLAYYSRGNPLVARVCGGDKSLEMSYEKQALLDKIDDFVPEEGLAVGPTVCAIGMYCWILTVLCELQRAEKLLSKFWLLPKASVTQVKLTSQGASHLTQVASGRFVLVIVIVVFRVVISVLILFGGLQWLANTPDLGDLLMNAVALEFVFSLDERIYQAMANAGMRMYIASEIKIPRSPAQNHIVRSQLYPLMMVVLSLSIAAFAMLYWLLPQVQTLHDAHDLLCSGNVAFVFTRLNAPGSFFGWSEASESYDAKQSGRADHIWSHEDHDFFDRSVIRLIRTLDPTQDKRLNGSLYPAVRWTQGSLVSFEGQSFQEQNYYSNQFCEDMQETTWDQDWNAVLDFVGNRDLERTCNNSNWTLACDDPTKLGQTARMFCPVTCGCASPESSQVLEGCPAQCLKDENYQALISQRPCVNSPDNALLSENSKWKLMLQQLKQAANAYTAKAAMALEYVSDMLSEWGCAGLDKLSNKGIDMCSDANTMPAPTRIKMRYYCPESCLCHKHAVQDGCPKQCLHLD